MLGFRIFLHAVRMLFLNFKTALRIILGPGLIIVSAYVALFFLTFGPLAARASDDGEPQAGEILAVVGIFFPAFFAVFFVMLWIAVGRHRFILLEEYPKGIFPVFHFDRIAHYFGLLLLLGLLGFVILLPVMLLFVGVA